MYTYKYPHPAVTTDSVVFGFDGKKLHILLIERGIEPYKGSWALPGGFMRIDETIEQCAARELFEETGVAGVFLEQFHIFSTVNRDPRERVLTVAFIALVRQTDYLLMAGDDAARADWFELDELPPLAFDHHEIIKQAREHLAVMLRTRPIAFELLDKNFSMSELQRIYEVIYNTTYDRRNFAKKMNSTGYLRRVDNEPERQIIHEDKCIARISNSFAPVAEVSKCIRIDDNDVVSFDGSGFEGDLLTHFSEPRNCNSIVSEEDSVEEDDFMPELKCRPMASTSKIVKRKGVNLYRFDEEAFKDDTKDTPPGRNPLLDV